MRSSTNRPHQAAWLQRLHRDQKTIWQTIPDLLNDAGLRTPHEVEYTIKSINHWKAKSSSRLIPKDAIPIVCSAYAAAKKGKAATLEKELHAEMARDSYRGDFWRRADSLLKSFRIIKLVYPPFTWHRADFKPKPGLDAVPFFELWLSRLRDFSGHLITTENETEIGKILEDMIESRRTSTRRIGFGLLSSIERLTLLEPLHTPIRVGINAVLAVSCSHSKAEVEHAKRNIQQFLCGRPTSGDAPATTAVGAVHEVGCTHLMHMFEQKLWPQLKIVRIPDLRPQEYVNKLTQRTDTLHFAVADEVTCLSVLREMASRKAHFDDGMHGELVFSLANVHTVQQEKTPLPEYLMSVLFPREDAVEERCGSWGYRFLKDALWMMLQSDVELLGGQYAVLCNTLKAYAEDALPSDRKAEAKPWAEYTLRLDRTALERYVDHQLPWHPILERAYEIYRA